MLFYTPNVKKKLNLWATKTVEYILHLCWLFFHLSPHTTYCCLTCIVINQYLQLDLCQPLSLFPILPPGVNMIKAPERKLKCYAVLWLFDDHALLRQTTCWSTSLFSARPCSWMRMWGCVVVCNLWGCITYQEFVFIKCRSYHLNWEIQTCCVTHVSHVRCRTSLCTATIVHRPV